MNEIMEMRSAGDGLPKGFVRGATPEPFPLATYLFLQVAAGFCGKQTAGLIDAVREAVKDGDTTIVADYLAANSQVDLNATVVLRGIAPSEALHPEQTSLLDYMLGDDPTSESKKIIAEMLNSPKRKAIYHTNSGGQPRGASPA